MVLGTEARRGHFPAVDDRWPSPKPAFKRLDGYVVLPHTKATIAVGLRMPRRATVRIEGGLVGYRQDGMDYTLRVDDRAALRFR
jgi:hypothetical protein